MGYCVGLDVSQKQTWICVVDDKGKTVAEGCSLTRARDVYGWLGNLVERVDIVQMGREAGNMSSWLYSGLTKLGMPVVCLESFQAHRFYRPNATRQIKTMRGDWRS